jgi:peptide/nickel transport system substrate-binding protein
MFQRRGNKESVDKGGWSIFPSMVAGVDVLNPAVAFLSRGNGLAGWYGWPTAPEMERLRDAWFDAPDLASQKAIAAELQAQIWKDAPYVPVGQILQPTAYRTSLTGVLDGFAKFYNVRKG